MLEAQAHQHLKLLLHREGDQGWPHHLSLSRLVGRSLRRGDHSLIRLAVGSGPSWWISLLVPLALSERPVALVVSDALRQRLLQVELPRLARSGLPLACAEGLEPPPEGTLWLLNHAQLVHAWQQRLLAQRQLVLPEAEQLDQHLRQAQAVSLTPADWDRLRRAIPGAEPALLALHGRLSRRLLTAPRTPAGLVAVGPSDEAPLQQLLAGLGPLPRPWSEWLRTSGSGWCSWATVDGDLLQWTLQRQPLEPLLPLAGLLHGRGAVMIGQLPRLQGGGIAESMGLTPQLDLVLGEAPLSDPLPLFAPRGQPLPNSPIYGEHLLEQSRRLVLGQAGLSVVLADDRQLLHQLTSALAAEFGSRVVHESTSPESNGVICSSWSWWIAHQQRLPQPEQLIVALLPIASLEDPLTAARVAALRQSGRDWFRELLLPEALVQLQRGVAPLRRWQGARLAILDGRLRGRSWGQQVLQALEPWVPLRRLLPS